MKKRVVPNAEETGFHLEDARSPWKWETPREFYGSEAWVNFPDDLRERITMDWEAARELA